MEARERWQRLQESSWRCASCGESHGGLFDLGLTKPDHWSGDEFLSNDQVGPGGHGLSEDLCALDGEHHFVRGVLFLPIIGAPTGDDFGYGVWSSLSRDNFAAYLDIFDAGTDNPPENWFGWFSNSLHGYPETLNLKCWVVPQPGNQRPHFKLEPTDHPLAIEQRDGISIDRLLELYALHGHEITLDN